MIGVELMEFGLFDDTQYDESKGDGLVEISGVCQTVSVTPINVSNIVTHVVP